MAARVWEPTELDNPGQNTAGLMNHAVVAAAAGAVTRNRTDAFHHP